MCWLDTFLLDWDTDLYAAEIGKYPGLLAAYFCDCACIMWSSMCLIVAKLQT